MTKRNNAIEFFRFLFCCMICLHHFRDFGDGTVFVGGFLGVDIFFVISGFFLMNHFMTREQETLTSPELTAFQYLKRRLDKLVPHHIFSWVIMAFITVFALKTYSASDVLMYGCWELFLLKATSLGNNITINGVTWYLSALVICSYLIYWILCRARARGDREGRIFSFIIGPVIYFVVTGYLWTARNDLNYWIQSAPILTGGFLRGISEMSLGCTTYAVVRGLREHYHGGKTADVIATVFEVLGWALMFYYLYHFKDKRDFAIPALAALLMVSMFTCRSYLCRLLDNRVSAFLGRISYPMYLNQFIFIRPLKKFCPELPFWQVAVPMLVALFVFTLFSDWLVRKITAKIAPLMKGSKGSQETDAA